MKRVLLHICCGVCSGFSLDKLHSLDYQITGFFFNPNIFPDTEYTKRLDAARIVCNAAKVDLMSGTYDHGAWQELCRGLEQAKEGGERCKVCFQMRLRVTYEYALKNGFDHFTTTLTVSPHKNSDHIFQIGRSIGGDKFLAIDFKQEDGFKKTLARAKALNIYRQNYCGCEYGKIAGNGRAV